MPIYLPSVTSPTLLVCTSHGHATDKFSCSCLHADNLIGRLPLHASDVVGTRREPGRTPRLRVSECQHGYAGAVCVRAIQQAEEMPAAAMASFCSAPNAACAMTVIVSDG